MYTLLNAHLFLYQQTNWKDNQGLYMHRVALTYFSLAIDTCFPTFKWFSPLACTSATQILLLSLQEEYWSRFCTHHNCSSYCRNSASQYLSNQRCSIYRYVLWVNNARRSAPKECGVIVISTLFDVAFHATVRWSARTYNSNKLAFWMRYLSPYITRDILQILIWSSEFSGSSNFSFSSLQSPFQVRGT